MLKAETMHRLHGLYMCIYTGLEVLFNSWVVCFSPRVLNTTGGSIALSLSSTKYRYYLVQGNTIQVTPIINQIDTAAAKPTTNIRIAPVDCRMKRNDAIMFVGLLQAASPTK